MINTHLSSTSQADGSNSDSTIFLFSVTTSIIGYSDDSEYMLDTGATGHVCPYRDLFSSFDNLDGCSVVMGDDRTCNMKGIDTILIKMFDRIV